MVAAKLAGVKPRIKLVPAPKNAVGMDDYTWSAMKYGSGFE
jgi:hypothetical protein